MLTSLVIKDFAIIDRLEASFRGGMTAITGETGAGKSIVIDALHLLLGGRASTDVIRANADAAVVEGAFHPLDRHARGVAERLESLGIDFDGELVVRRVVSRSGRNKVIVNGSLATVATLRGLMRGLVDISGQHEHYSLLDGARHVVLLDRFAGVEAQSKQVAADFAQLSGLRSELSTLRGEARDRLVRIDYLSYQLKELAAVMLEPQEVEQLKAEREVLAHAEALRDATYSAIQRLYEDDGSVCEGLDAVVAGLTRVRKHAADLSTLCDRLGEARSIVDDVSHELRAFAELDVDPRRLDVIESKLNELDRMTRKFGCRLDELHQEREKMRQELERLESAESHIDTLETQVHEASQRLLSQARALSQARNAAAPRLSAAIETRLEALGMQRSALCVDIETVDEPESLRASGMDRVEFLLAPNPGEPAKPLARIASGGELSRVMLAIKQVLSASDDVATYVFDEVDAGIGGTVATQVARALQGVSSGHQVLCISHLAVIASHADEHWIVEKRTDGERTTSQLRCLSEAERVDEIARMLGGLQVTPRTLEHAAEMVRAARIVN